MCVDNTRGRFDSCQPQCLTKEGRCGMAKYTLKVVVRVTKDCGADTLPDVVNTSQVELSQSDDLVAIMKDRDKVMVMLKQ